MQFSTARSVQFSMAGNTQRLHTALRGARDDAGLGDARAGGRALRGGARHAAVACGQALRGRGAGGGRPLGGPLGRGGREGVQAGPRLRDAVRRPGAWAAGVRDRRPKFGRAGRVQGGVEGARRQRGADRGAVHGHVAGVPEGGVRGVSGGGGDVRPVPRGEAAERGGRHGAPPRAEEAAGAEAHAVDVAVEPGAAVPAPTGVAGQAAGPVADRPGDGAGVPAEAGVPGVLEAAARAGGSASRAMVRGGVGERAGADGQGGGDDPEARGGHLGVVPLADQQRDAGGHELAGPGGKAPGPRYRTTENFIAVAYVVCGKLDFKHPT